jgi:hypothetical protein
MQDCAKRFCLQFLAPTIYAVLVENSQKSKVDKSVTLVTYLILRDRL